MKTDVPQPDQTRALDTILAKIATQASTGEGLTPSPSEWVKALPHMDGVACEWSMEDTLFRSYMWHEDGDYYARQLGPGLEDREDVPLDRHAAAALLEGIMHKPVDRSEVPE